MGRERERGRGGEGGEERDEVRDEVRDEEEVRDMKRERGVGMFTARGSRIGQAAVHWQ